MKWEQYLRLRICGAKWLQTLPALVCVHATILHTFLIEKRCFFVCQGRKIIILRQLKDKKSEKTSDCIDSLCVHGSMYKQQ